ncbi:hypothetical protein FS749_016459 [Ceratobasidium sp. UAMH 11750]|nr:hypothetical protein FS749_016459 [Ceratobasidium sp. UAMH 11750]
MAAQQRSIWGPGMGQYSRRFEPRISTILDEKTERLYRACKLPSLAHIETQLYKTDLRIGEDGLMNLATVTTILRRYKTVNKKKIFECYYGFLCVRHLLYLTCLAILQTSTLGEELEPCRPNMSWEEMTHELATEAMERAGRVATDMALLERLYLVIWCSKRFTGKPDIVLLSRALWEDRGSFLTLCMRGLLPGCALLVFACCQLIQEGRSEEESRQEYLYLQDLAFRVYLVGSYRDRQVAQLVGLEVLERDTGWLNKSGSYLSLEDSKTISKAFSDLLLAWQQDTSIFRDVEVNLLSGLARFVQVMTATSPLLETEESIQVSRTSLQLLWLVFETRGRMEVDEHFQIRHFALVAFDYVKFLHQILATKDQRRRFAEMLAGVEIISVLGRTLLLVLDEGHEFEDTELLAEICEQIASLKDVVGEAASVAPDSLLQESKIDFLKVMAQAGWALHTGRVNFTDLTSNSGTADYVVDMMGSWAVFMDPLDEGHHVSEDCAYPRCHQVSTRETMLRVRYVCGRCNAVAYCDSNCQRAHWQLATSESHRLECIPSGGLALVKRDRF